MYSVVASHGISHKANPARNFLVIGAFPGIGPRATCNLTRNPSLITVPSEVEIKTNLTRNPSPENSISPQSS